MLHLLYIIPSLIILTVCKNYDNQIKSGKPPHLVIDTTKTGSSSETVKLFTAALGLPTVSGSYGQFGDLRQWENLDKDKQKYLLQVMHPVDMIPQVVRSIIEYQAITNVAVLYDDTFSKLLAIFTSTKVINLFGLSVMIHKLKSLLQNIATRHIIVPIAKKEDRRNQIQKLRDSDMTNFIILGAIQSIEDVLGKSDSDYYNIDADIKAN